MISPITKGFTNRCWNGFSRLAAHSFLSRFKVTFDQYGAEEVFFLPGKVLKTIDFCRNNLRQAP
ncbi:MAG: hypothetical protein PHF37_05640 [Phycisphaerae bacterium]|nr:hypothetical protein [Phycisphaerae bacterium]